ncbi:uncharacterized protein CBL_06827 [Carabus blaptoides fortunei]
MAEDTTDGEIILPNFALERRKAPSLEILHNEMPCRRPQKEFGRRALKTLFNRLRLRKYASADISTPDPSYKVAYLGNVLTGWAKGEGCVEKPLSTLWRNYTQSSRPDVRMELTVSGGGLKAHTKDHGLTEYWANRITFCAAPKQFPRLFCWVYRHEGRRLRHELRCHAVLCSSNSLARRIEQQLRSSLSQALAEFKKDKVSRQNARLSLVNSIYENPSMPRRKIMLSTGATNYRPPLERSKSAPKLTMIEESVGEEDEDCAESYPRIARFTIGSNFRLLRHCDSTSTLIDKRQALRRRLSETSNLRRIPVNEKSAEPAHEETIIEEAGDERSNRILEEIVAESFRTEKNEQNIDMSWFRRTDIPADLIPLDSDEGSLSSGCESASTVTSEAEAAQSLDDPKKPEPDFKVGGTVLSRVTSLERLTNCADVRKYCNLKHSLRVAQEFPDTDEVSLIPVGESQTDFSSLKVYKKRTPVEVSFVDTADGGSGSEGEADSACSDESGYSELIDCPPQEPDSPISKIVMV